MKRFSVPEGPGRGCCIKRTVIWKPKYGVRFRLRGNIGYETFGGWHRDFERFRERFQVEHASFESWILSNGVIEREQFLGAYYERREGEEDNSILV